MTRNNPVTYFLLGLTTLVALVGAVVVITTDDLSFAEYLEQLKTFAVALGVLAVGRGILGAGEKRAQFEQLQSLEGDASDTTAHGH